MAKVIVFTDARGRLVLRRPAFNDRTNAGLTEEEQLQREADRAVSSGKAADTPVVMEESDVEADRSFRNAFVKNDSGVAVDMSKARDLHMDHIRQQRNKELVKLDVPYMKSLESGDTDAQAEIATRKQTLRDIPATFDLTGASNSSELKALWPDGVERDE
jgi:hypothetical protein